MMDKARGHKLIKSFLARAGALLLVLVVLDVTLGAGLDYVSSRITSGEAGRDNYISDSVVSDVLIMGSSKAFRHYREEVVEKYIVYFIIALAVLIIIPKIVRKVRKLRKEIREA